MLKRFFILLACILLISPIIAEEPQGFQFRWVRRAELMQLEQAEVVEVAIDAENNYRKAHNKSERLERIIRRKDNRIDRLLARSRFAAGILVSSIFMSGIIVSLIVLKFVMIFK